MGMLAFNVYFDIRGLERAETVGYILRSQDYVSN